MATPAFTIIATVGWPTKANPDKVLATFNSLEEVENYQPENVQGLIDAGYTKLELIPYGWTDTPAGSAPFATVKLESENQ